MSNTFPFYDAEPYWPKGGYGHHGGEEGSGSTATTDFYIFVESSDIAALELLILEQDDRESFLEYEPMIIDGAEFPYCYHYKNCPVGALIMKPGISLPALYYNDQLQPLTESTFSMGRTLPLYCPRPLDGHYITGWYNGESPK